MERPTLTPRPIKRPRDWTARVNRPLGPKEEEAILRSMHRGQPFGSGSWQGEVAARLGLESLLRPEADHENNRTTAPNPFVPFLESLLWPRGGPRKQPSNGS